MIETVVLIIVSLILVFRGINTNTPALMIIGCVAAFVAGWMYR